MSTSADLRISPEEYLRIERADEWRNEYLDGEIFPREHPSVRHIIIAANLMRDIGEQLRDRPNVVYAGRRVVVDPHRHYVYPDVVVSDEIPEIFDDDNLINPKVLGEVFSESTEEYDRGEKFERYRAVPSLAEYLLVAQDRVHAELYTRQPDDSWLLREWNDPAEEIELVSLGCRLKVAGIYAKVDFAAR
jgi:Uma2 family endonuclease